jgi:hypothetical protein
VTTKPKHPDGVETYRRAYTVAVAVDATGDPIPDPPRIVLYGWRYWSKGRIIATDGGQGYTNRETMLTTLARMLGGHLVRTHEENPAIRRWTDRNDRAGAGWEEIPVRAAADGDPDDDTDGTEP